MWDIRRRLDTAELPERHSVVRFYFRDARPGRRWWWLVVDGAEVDLCVTDPGRDVDLTVQTTGRTMCRVWIGRLPIEDALDSGEVALVGSTTLARSFHRWLGVPSRARELEDALNNLRVNTPPPACAQHPLLPASNEAWTSARDDRPERSSR